jgi:hypothetical protein
MVKWDFEYSLFFGVACVHSKMLNIWNSVSPYDCISCLLYAAQYSKTFTVYKHNFFKILFYFMFYTYWLMYELPDVED